MKQLTQQEMDLLLDKAQEARDHSYAPYSKYNVGAALMTADGQIYQGCNIENAAFGPTICAERVAMFKAVYDGERDFEAIAVVGGRAGQEITGLFPPCGVCRQVLREFCGLDFKLYLGKENNEFIETTLGDMLPYSFSATDMK